MTTDKLAGVADGASRPGVGTSRFGAWSQGYIVDETAASGPARQLLVFGVIVTWRPIMDP